MATIYHKKTINHLVKYGKSININEVYKSKENQIPLAFPRANPPIVPLYYDPDVQYYIEKGKNEQYVIFEVADKQGRDKTIADIVRAYLCPHNIIMLFFIVPTDEKYKIIDSTQKIIVHSLNKKIKKGKSKKLPVEVRVVKIPKEKLISEKEVFKILDKEVKSVI